jgi:quinol monooxygenase YgiN
VIFITAKFRVLADHADHWADITQEFTQATRAESGNLWFDWSRSLDDPTEYVLVEAFRDGEAGAAHGSPITSRPRSLRCPNTSSRHRASSAR